MDQKSARAYTNIALIKYWGKKNQELKIPLMSSISMTLDSFYTDTTFIHDKNITSNSLSINGVNQDSEHSKRVFSYINKLQEKYGLKDHYKIVSTNHVPTSAGLASSASAFAALAMAFSGSYQLNLSKKELSKIARLGSGSAARSIYGGLVLWKKGTNDNDSYAIALDSDPNWDIHMLAVEINTKEKKISSTTGMLQAQTSSFYGPWLEKNKLEISEMKKAIKQHDFTELGKLAELSANEMHAINLSARPGFTYFSPDTIKVMELVNKLRNAGIECYYTIDAGPNVKIICKLKDVKEITLSIQNLLDNVKIVNASFGPDAYFLD